MDLYSEMVNIAKIRDGLFIGDVVAGTTLDIVFEFKISHMINTCSSQVPSQFTSIGIKYLNLAWPEHPSLNLPLIKDDLVTKIVNFIDGCLRNGDGLMIYSYKGQNRCCAIILIYLMRKYFWSLQKSKEYLLCKKQDMKLSKNILEHLIGYENHLHKLFPNKIKSTTWTTVNLKDGEELLMSNTYINEVEISKKPIMFSKNKKDSNKHIGWADDKNNEKNKNTDKKLVNYDIEEDLFLKKNIKDITCHLIRQDLKSVIKKNNLLEDKNEELLNTENSKDNISKTNEKDKVEFFDTNDLLQSNKNEEKDKEEIRTKNNSKIIIENKDKEKEIKINKDINDKENNNMNLIFNKNKESISEFNISNQNDSSNKKNNNKMKFNILKNMPQKDLKGQMIYNTGGEDQKLKLDFPLKEFNNNKYKNNNVNPNMNNMNINFNDLNIPNFNQKYFNNFLENNEPNIKRGNNYPLYLKNKGNKKSHSSTKHNNNNNIIPFIDYNQNNNIITNFMLNHNNNQKLFVKFNKDIQRASDDLSNNIINNNNQFIQNNNFININYYPQPNEPNLIPGINNYNPLKNKPKKFGSPYNDINIIGNHHPHQNNFMKRNNKNYDKFNINNYDSNKPIKLLQPGHKKSISTDKSSKKQNNFLFNQPYIVKPQNKVRNSVDLKRPSTAPQKYKIAKNKNANILGSGSNRVGNYFGLGMGIQVDQNNKAPKTYSNGFYKNNKRLSSPMVSGGQKFGATQKFKFNNYKLPSPGHNLFNFKKKGF